MKRRETGSVDIGNFEGDRARTVIMIVAGIGIKRDKEPGNCWSAKDVKEDSDGVFLMNFRLMKRTPMYQVTRGTVLRR